MAEACLGEELIAGVTLLVCTPGALNAGCAGAASCRSCLGSLARSLLSSNSLRIWAIFSSSPAPTGVGFSTAYAANRAAGPPKGDDVNVVKSITSAACFLGSRALAASEITVSAIRFVPRESPIPRRPLGAALDRGLIPDRIAGGKLL